MWSKPMLSSDEIMQNAQETRVIMEAMITGDQITYCWDCGKITDGFRLCPTCDIKADREYDDYEDSNR